MTDTRWKKVNDNDGPVWNPKGETLADFDAQDEANNNLEGYLIDVKHDVGKNKSTLYKIHEVNQDGSFGEVYGVWGSAVLDGSMNTIVLGSFVKIEYLGYKIKKGMEGKTFKAGTTHFHNWQVFTDPNALPYNDAKNGNKKAVEPVEQTPPAKRSSRGAAPVSNQTPSPAFNDDDLPF